MSMHDGTNTQLIPLTDHDGIQAVMGRDLHAFLESGEQYVTWFKRMVTYGFTEGVDYVHKNKKIERPAPLPPAVKTDHVLTLDMAKEISMIQRTDKGKQARQYFIECERRAHAPKIDGTELTRRIISNERAGKAAATPSVRGGTTGLRGCVGCGRAVEGGSSVGVFGGGACCCAEFGGGEGHGAFKFSGGQHSSRPPLEFAARCTTGYGVGRYKRSTGEVAASRCMDSKLGALNHG